MNNATNVQASPPGPCEALSPLSHCFNAWAMGAGYWISPPDSLVKALPPAEWLPINWHEGSVSIALGAGCVGPCVVGDLMFCGGL